MYKLINERRAKRADTILDQNITTFIDEFSTRHDDESLQAYALSELMISWSGGEDISTARVARETAGARKHIAEWAEWFQKEIQEYEPYA